MGGPLKAIVLSETGGPERLELREVPEPVPEEGQVLVRVRAAALNFLDVLVRGGRYAQAPELPTIPGIEIAGERLDTGERVLGLPRASGGGYAEVAAVDEQWLEPLPASATFAEGAAFPMAFLTAWLPLTRQARVGPGTTVLVHAAAGGVGSAAVQVARHLGARVVATAGSEEKLTLARELGAELAVNCREEDWPERVGRVDVVVDPVGGAVFERSLALLRPLGTVIAIGYAAGAWKPLDPALLVGRNAGVQGFYLGRLIRHAPALVRQAIDELSALWVEGRVRPVVGKELPLAEAAEAHRLLEERRSLGKVVLVP